MAERRSSLVHSSGWPLMSLQNRFQALSNLEDNKSTSPTSPRAGKKTSTMKKRGKKNRRFNRDFNLNKGSAKKYRENDENMEPNASKSKKPVPCLKQTEANEASGSENEKCKKANGQELVPCLINLTNAQQLILPRNETKEAKVSYSKKSLKKLNKAASPPVTEKSPSNRCLRRNSYQARQQRTHRMKKAWRPRRKTVTVNEGIVLQYALDQTLKHIREPKSSKSSKKRKITKLEVLDTLPTKKQKEDYEVESVVNMKCVQGEYYYEVKWRGWSSLSNTWEPAEHLTNCPEALFSFLDATFFEFNIEENRYSTLKAEALSFEDSELNEALKQFASEDKIDIPYPDYKDVEKCLKIMSKIPEPQFDPELISVLREKTVICTLYEKRKAQLKLLKDWEDELNQKIVENYYVKVENNVDLIPPPSDFSYINEYVLGENVNPPQRAFIRCNCKVSCSSKTRCCPRIEGWSYGYDDNGRLKLKLGKAIIECNSKCSCGPDCNNRIVQRGATIPLCIFRTSNGCGWGVKAIQHIPKGVFVTQYWGEVITNMEADRRGKMYDSHNQTYLFDLDFDSKEDFLYCVDAAYMGNVSHFINHSCDPNMHVYAVFDEYNDPNMPKLAFFSNRDIYPGEQITFDYLNNPTEVERNENPKNEIMVCKCGSTKCRKFYM